MYSNAWLVLVAATLLGFSALGDGAEAGRCRPGWACGGSIQLDIQAASEFHRKGRRERPVLGLFSQAVGSDEIPADNESYDGSLIPESMAVTQALAAYPNGRPLGVKLLPGPSPVYAVKLRVDGQVLRVLVDAQSAQILGQ